MKRKPHRKESAAMRKRSCDCLISKLPKPQSLTAFRAPMPNAAIVTQSTNSLTGIARSRDYRSARPWWSDTECIWNRDTSPQEPLTSASERCAAWHMKQRTAAS